MNRSKSFLSTGAVFTVFGAGHFILAQFGREFRFYQIFGPFKNVAAVVFILIGVGLILWPFLGDKIFKKKEQKENDGE